MKTLWLKFKSTKFFAVLLKIGKAFAKFTRCYYAAQISFLFIGLIVWGLAGKFWGILALAWGLILLFAEVKQQKADKEITGAQ